MKKMLLTVYDSDDMHDEEEHDSYNAEIQMAGTGIVRIDWGDESAIETHNLSAFNSEEELMKAVFKGINGYTRLDNYFHWFRDKADHTITITGENILLLDCGYMNLSNLDVSKNTALKVLYCNENELTSLDVSKNIALVELACNYGKITKLDVSGCITLNKLFCYYNKLTELDVSENTALNKLDCYDNKLTNLDISNNTLLKELYCEKNQLTSLDINKNTILVSLNCSKNQLSSLDISKNIELNNILCSNNLLSGDILNILFETLPIGEEKEGFNYIKSESWRIPAFKDNLICIKGNPGTNSCKKFTAKSRGWTFFYLSYNKDIILDR